MSDDPQQNCEFFYWFSVLAWPIQFGLTVANNVHLPSMPVNASQPTTKLAAPPAYVYPDQNSYYQQDVHGQSVQYMVSENIIFRARVGAHALLSTALYIVVTCKLQMWVPQ